MTVSSAPAAAIPHARPQLPLWQKLLPWLVTAACLAFLYTRLDGAARAQGSALVPYLAEVFARVSWFRWLGLLVPYCLFFFLIDTMVVWRVVNWFNTRITYSEIVPVRASSYILSIINEQVSKGAVALYLHRRANVPGWEVGSSMIFIMFCELYYLMAWATIGVALQGDALPAVFHSIPGIFAGALVFLAVFFLFFSGRIPAGPLATLRDKPIFHAFRKAKLWYYGAFFVMRSPMMLGAVFVYTRSLGLFGIEAGYLQVLGYLPVILFGATTPGPMRSVAILLWVVLFPEKPGEVTAFGFVQHNFFILFNAAIGLVFLRKATADLFEPPATPA
ncbi:MAG: hypothetical protein AB7I25_12155 [Vicinamibacterales bacterium]